MNQTESLESLSPEVFSRGGQKVDLSDGHQKMRKIFVLDTNVLIHDPNSISSFDEHDVVIPFIVLEELDRLKKGHGEIAASARAALRIIDQLREKGSLISGIEIGTGGLLSIGTTLSSASAAFMDGITEDNKIIKTALGVVESQQTDERGNIVPVTLVSKDTISPQLHGLSKFAFSTKSGHCQKIKASFIAMEGEQLSGTMVPGSIT